MIVAKTEQYTVLKQLEHDGEQYPPGAPIDLQDGNAEYLLRKGMVGKIEQSKKQTAAGTANVKGSEA